MAKQTLKQMLDSVSLECGLDTESAYIANSNDEVVRLTKLANRSALRLATAFNWQGLRATHLFTMTTATTYSLPSDFRALISDTGFADSFYAPVDFATDPTLWAYLGSNNASVGPRYRMRILGDKIHVHDPEDGVEVKFEYLKDAPVLDTDGTTRKQRFDADTDTFVLDDDLLEMDLIWRLKKLLGLDWQVDYSEFKDYFRTAKGQDAGAKTIIGRDEYHIPGTPYTDLYVDNPAT